MPDWGLAIALLVVAALLLALSELIFQVRRLQRIAAGPNPEARPVRPTGPVIDVGGEDLAPVEKERSMTR